MSKPLGYRTPNQLWFCPACFESCGEQGVPFYAENFVPADRRDCVGCLALIWPQPEPIPVPCVFCDIVSGKAPAEWVLQPDYWPDAVAFLSNQPLAENHTLIVPKIHVPHFASSPEVARVVAGRAAELMQFTNRPMTYLSMQGKDAGQEIMHFHLHLIPREAGDGLRIVSRSRGGKKNDARGARDN